MRESVEWNDWNAPREQGDLGHDMVSVTVGATVNGLVDGKRSNGRADRHRRQDPTIDSKDKDREQTDLPEERGLCIS